MSKKTRRISAKTTALLVLTAMLLTALLAGCSGDDAESSPSPTVTVTVAPTETPTQAPATEAPADTTEEEDAAPSYTVDPASNSNLVPATAPASASDVQ